MKRCFRLARLWLLGCVAISALAAHAELPIIPRPAYYKELPGKSFATGRKVAVNVSADLDERLPWLAHNFVRQVLHAPAIDINAKAVVILRERETIAPEGYELHIAPDTILIEASDNAGIFYAFKTLEQLCSASDHHNIPAASISDRPRMSWRGFMLDEGRHFFGKEEIKRVIDLLALYKFNRLHWHLTDDQGWRLEIKKWPKLTEVGAWRESEVIEGPWIKPVKLDKPYGGFYTQDDIREIVEYAKGRYIEIIPEIDMPGHTQAMVASYPELLACDPDSAHTVWTWSGVTDDVINVAKPEAVSMTKDIIDELIELFPSRYIHLGGDECPTTKWERDSLCTARLKAIGSDNYRDLQLDFYRELEEYIALKPENERRKLIFWNEVLHGNTKLLSDSITIMSWIGTEEAERDGLEAAKRGYDVIMTPQVPYYINRRQSLDEREPRTQGPGRETLEMVYNYKPVHNIPYELRDKYQGVQANFWSEFVPDAATLEFMMLPRLTAVAEAAWTPEYLRDYSDYLKRLQHHKLIFDQRGYRYAPYAFE